MSTSSHVIGLPQPHLDRTSLCDIDESEYDRRYLAARDKLRRLIKEDLPNRVLKKDVNGPDLADMIEETVAALNERDFPTSASLVSYFNKDLVERLGREFETSLERAVTLPNDVEKIESAAALLADAIETQFMENKFGADVSEPRKALEALISDALSAVIDKNELASAKVCERMELECERVMEREASQPIPSKGKFRKRYHECAERFQHACVGPALVRNQERLTHAWDREVARFDKEFNDRLLNGVVFVTIAWVVVFRFIIRIAIAETIGWIAFVFLQVYPRTFIGSGTSVYETGWWEGLVKAWEAVVDNGVVDPDVLAYLVAAGLAAYYFRDAIRRCCFCCCRVRIRPPKTHETKDLDV